MGTRPVIYKGPLGLLALFAVMASAGPARAATTSGTGEAVIVTPLSLVNTAPLSFGNLLPSASAGTAVVDEFTEARTVTGGVTAAGGTVSAATFTGLTSPPSHLKITIPNAPVTLTRVGGGASMTATNFELNGDKNDWVAANTMFTFQVGATLNVGANQMPGTYTGTFSVTVEYR